MSRSPAWVRAARVVKPHGIDGELSLEMLGGDRDRLPPGTVVRAGAAVLTVEEARASARGLICRLTGISDRDAAAALSGSYLEVEGTTVRRLPLGEFFHYQLVGLKVVDEHGLVRGRVVDVEPYPANDVYVVKTEAGEVRVPAVRQAIADVDLAAATMTVGSAYLEGWVDAV